MLFHHYNQFKSFFTNPNINWQRNRVIWTSNLLTVFFSLFSFLFLLLVCSCFFSFFFFPLSMLQFLCSFFFFSRRSVSFPSFCCWFALVFFIFYFCCLNKPFRNRFLVVLSLIIWSSPWNPVRNHIMNDMSRASAPNRIKMLYSHDHNQLYKHIIHLHLHVHAES